MIGSCGGRPLAAGSSFHRRAAQRHNSQHLHAYRARSIFRALSQLQAQAKHTHDYDVVALGNLCVDVVLPVDALPAPDAGVRQQLLRRLTASPPSTDSWEVGGSCNFTIAASRLGLKVATVGHVAADVYGDFLRDVLLVRDRSMLHACQI